MEHDLSFNSGERQTAATYDDVRADHRFRYEWADRVIPRDGFGLDAFCGNGYGAWLLSQTRHVLALDGSLEAVNFAAVNFSTPTARFAHAYWPFELPVKSFDFAVSLESIEHVPDGMAFFEAMVAALKPGGILIFSTPNEDLLPHALTGNHFHFRHFTLSETLDMAYSNGLNVIEWAGQDTYDILPDGRIGGLLPPEDMVLKNYVPGQFTIVGCSKSTASSGQHFSWISRLFNPSNGRRTGQVQKAALRII